MIKLMTLFKSPAGVAPEPFREYLATEFLPAFKAIPAVAAHLVKAVHHHALDLVEKQLHNLRESIASDFGSQFVHAHPVDHLHLHH